MLLKKQTATHDLQMTFLKLGQGILHSILCAAWLKTTAIVKMCKYLGIIAHLILN